MKNIFLWYFFSYNHHSRPRRAPLYKHKTWLRDPPRNKRQQSKRSCTDLFSFDSHTTTMTIMSRQSHTHRHLNHKNILFLMFSFTSSSVWNVRECMTVCSSRYVYMRICVLCCTHFPSFSYRNCTFLDVNSQIPSTSPFSSIFAHNRLQPIHSTFVAEV